MFRGPKLPTTYRLLIEGASTTERRDYANRCPNPLTHANQPATATPAPTCGANSIPVAAKQNYARWRVNHDAMEEAQEAPNVVLGMFFVNDTSAVVLFHSRASHSFICAAYVEKHNLHSPA
jgi:hypothetical protein